MLIKTILNKCHPVKGFVYGKAYLKNNTIFINISNRKNSKGKCSICNKKYSTYDHLTERKFKFIPFWGFEVYLKYKLRRVSCPTHGVTVETVPWAKGKSPICHVFKNFLAHWAKYLSWKDVSLNFNVSLKNVFDSVKYVVEYGLAHRDLSSVTAIGIDEIKWKIGHQYLTLVYQINKGARRLIYIGKDRTVKTILRFCFKFGKENLSNIEVVCSDLWKPYLKVIKKKLPSAIHILDKFHISKYLNDAVDKTRRSETKLYCTEKSRPLKKTFFI